MRLTGKRLAEKMERGEDYTVGRLVTMTQSSVSHVSRALRDAESRGLVTHNEPNWRKV